MTAGGATTGATWGGKVGRFIFERWQNLSLRKGDSFPVARDKMTNREVFPMTPWLQVIVPPLQPQGSFLQQSVRNAYVSSFLLLQHFTTGIPIAYFAAFYLKVYQFLLFFQG